MAIYPTKALLFKWGAAEDDKCAFCQQKETVAHVLLECETAKDTYQNLRYILDDIPDIHNTYPRQNDLSPEGIITLHNLKPDIATLVIIIKHKLLLQKENKTPLSQDAIMAIANSQYQIEKRIAYNQNKLSKHNLKWSTLSPILLQNRE